MYVCYVYIKELWRSFALRRQPTAGPFDIFRPVLVPIFSIKSGLFFALFRWKSPETIMCAHSTVRQPKSSKSDTFKLHYFIVVSQYHSFYIFYTIKWTSNFVLRAKKIFSLLAPKYHCARWKEICTWESFFVNSKWSTSLECP